MTAVAGFVHPALVYRDLDELVGALVPFVVEGVREREPVFVAVGAEELGALRSRVHDCDVTWTDTSEWHPHPARRLRAFHVFVTDRLRAGASRIRLVGEPAWPSSGPREFVREWARYESILNTVLAPFPVTLVCTYPASRLDAGIVEDASRTHPVIARRAGWQPSERFEEPASLVSRWNPALDPPPTDAERMPTPADLASARGFVLARAAQAGLSAGRATDLELAVDEILTNAIVHAGGIAALRTWIASESLICQVEDRGRGITDALAGYRPPATGPPGGRGLWLARQAVDLLQIVSTGAGTIVRLHVRLNDR